MTRTNKIAYGYFLFNNRWSIIIELDHTSLCYNGCNLCCYVYLFVLTTKKAQKKERKKQSEKKNYAESCDLLNNYYLYQKHIKCIYTKVMHSCMGPKIYINSCMLDCWKDLPKYMKSTSTFLFSEGIDDSMRNTLY